jgi:hypothetical protein
LAKARADAEESYGIQIQELARNVVHKGGLPGDEGASARKAFDGMRKEMEEVRITQIPRSRKSGRECKLTLFL